jgi:hypothetical protein
MTKQKSEKAIEPTVDRWREPAPGARERERAI